MIRVHRLLFVIAVAAGLVSKFSHVHGLSVFLHLSTSSNPDFEKNMDLTAFVTLINEFVTQGTKFKLCALVFQRINDLGILSRPKPKRGTRAGRLHRLWHCLSHCLVHHAVTPPGDHPSTTVSPLPCGQPGDHPSTTVSPLPCGQPGDQPSTIVSTLPCGQPGDHPSVTVSPLPCGQPGDHPSTSVSPVPSGQPGDHPSTTVSPLPYGQPGDHPSTSVSPLPCGQPGDHPSTSPLPCGQPGDHPSTSVSPLPCGQPGDHPSTSPLPCGQPGDHPSTSVSPLSCGQPGDHPSTSPLPCGQPGDHPSTAVSPLPSDQPDHHLVNHLGDVSAGCSPCLPFTVGSPPVVSSPSSPPLSPTCSSAPRPRKATHVIVGVWNARSAVNKALEVNEMIVERDLDVLCLTETWLREEGDDVSTGEMTPPGFSFLHRPRVSGRGGGVALIFRQHLNVRLCKHRSFSSFENIEVCITRGKQTIRLGCVYRPPPSAGNKLTTCDFIDEFGMFLSDDSIPAENVLVVGDFNFHMDKPNDPDTRRFVQLYNPLGFDQFVTEPTHVKGHILDIVLCRARTLVTSVNVDNLCMSDHFLLTIGTDLSRPRVPRKVVKCRNVKGIDRSLFRADIAQSPLVIGSPDGVDDLLDLYNATLLGLLNKHAPEKEKVVPDRPSSPWINEAVIKARQARRRAHIYLHIPILQYVITYTYLLQYVITYTYILSH